MVCCVAVVLGALSSLIPEEIDNFEYQAWAKCGLGSSVTLKMISKSAGQKLEAETTTTLKSRDEQALVLEVKSMVVIAGKRIDQPAQTRSVPAKIKKPAMVDPKGDAVAKVKSESGKQEIEVAGRKWPCTWTKTVFDSVGSQTTSTVWMCDELPTRMVKMESTTTGKIASTITQVVTRAVIEP